MLVWGGISDTNRGRYYYLYLLEVETEELKANSQHRALHDKNCILLRRNELSVCIKEYWIILVVLSQLNIKLQIIISALQGLDTLRTLLWNNLAMWSTWCCSRHQTEGWFDTITRITREALLYTVYYTLLTISTAWLLELKVKPAGPVAGRVMLRPSPRPHSAVFSPRNIR